MGIAGMTSPREPMKKNKTFFLPVSAIAGAEKAKEEAVGHGSQPCKLIPQCGSGGVAATIGALQLRRRLTDPTMSQRLGERW